MKRRDAGEPSDGFTVLELLVVVAVIAVVAMLLTAAVRRGRDSGDSTQCVNNIRQLAQANLRYATENGGQFCWAMDKPNRRRWHGERRDLDESFDPTKGPLAPYLGRESRVKICPAFENILTGGKSFEEGSGRVQCHLYRRIRPEPMGRRKGFQHRARGEHHHVYRLSHGAVQRSSRVPVFRTLEMGELGREPCGHPHAERSLPPSRVGQCRVVRRPRHCGETNGPAGEQLLWRRQLEVQNRLVRALRTERILEPAATDGGVSLEARD
jgi:prepilin-type N-terminal cleavage/methylation domain-containing protein